MQLPLVLKHALDVSKGDTFNGSSITLFSVVLNATLAVLTAPMRSITAQRVSPKSSSWPQIPIAGSVVMLMKTLAHAFSASRNLIAFYVVMTRTWRLQLTTKHFATIVLRIAQAVWRKDSVRDAQRDFTSRMMFALRSVAMRFHITSIVIWS